MILEDIVYRLGYKDDFGYSCNGLTRHQKTIPEDEVWMKVGSDKVYVGLQSVKQVQWRH